MVKRGRLTNSLTILEEPLRASLWTLESSVLDDFDFDFEADLEAEDDLEVDEVVLDERVVRGSDMVGAVVVLNGWWVSLVLRRFVDGEAVDEATLAEAAGVLGARNRRLSYANTAHE